jgi:cell division protein FtsB
MQILFASILAIGLLLAINFGNRITAGQRAQESLRSVQSEIATLEAEQASLRQELDYVRSDQYVESWARSDGKMAREGEVLVVPVPAMEGGSAAANLAPDATPPNIQINDEPLVENWRLWWALFLDDPAPY